MKSSHCKFSLFSFSPGLEDDRPEPPHERSDASEPDPPGPSVPPPVPVRSGPRSRLHHVRGDPGDHLPGHRELQKNRQAPGGPQGTGRVLRKEELKQVRKFSSGWIKKKNRKNSAIIKFSLQIFMVREIFDLWFLFEKRTLKIYKLFSCITPKTGKLATLCFRTCFSFQLLTM